MAKPPPLLGLAGVKSRQSGATEPVGTEPRPSYAYILKVRVSRVQTPPIVWIFRRILG